MMLRNACWKIRIPGSLGKGSEVFGERQSEEGVFMKDKLFMTENIREEFKFVRAVVEHEDNLINHRNSWLILAQSFLIVAYVQSSCEPYRFPIFLAGLLSTAFCYVSIWSAVIALRQLRKDCGRKFDNYYPYLTSQTTRHYCGLFGALAIPPTLIVIWIWLWAAR